VVVRVVHALYAALYLAEFAIPKPFCAP